jgi:hypothetical protein
MTEGQLTGQPLALIAESDRLVAFGDGIEPDSISLTWGQTVEIGFAKQRLRLVR